MAMLASFAESKHAVIRYNWLTGKREIVAGKHNISGLSVAYTPEQVGGILKECLKIRMRGGRKIDKCQEPDRIATTKCSGRASNFCAQFWSCEYQKFAHCKSKFVISHRRIYNGWERMRRRMMYRRRWGRWGGRRWRR